ncbi:hypothetical protein [Lentibacillus sp.]|uniref:hypothetical protein n=1 Tax=Lentibacillus sp. TaxID=1925746 RepID=UPI002B4AD110|nr:hypothetical protein [Lentibacillus sp.]HLS10164.1 hypothetical protein [Lentibacillus sp.]
MISVVPIERIIGAYGIYPYHIEQQSDCLYKVSDGRHAYALKRSKLTEDAVLRWEQVYHQAYASHLVNVLPVYLTETGELYVRMDDSYYYLTPWITDRNPGHERCISDAYEAIGRVHAKTKQSISMDTAAVMQKFNDYQQHCVERHEALLTYVELFERNRFMSPFELQVCTHYHVLVNVLAELDDHVEQLKVMLEHERKWHYSLLHGNLNLSHFLHQNNTYIINWERAAYDNAVVDLSIFLKRQVQYHDQQTSQLAELFPAYQEQNPLTEMEQHLLTVYLLDPSDYITLIDDYMANTGQTLVKQVQLLQRAFRRLEFGRRWSQLNEYDDSTVSPENESGD